MNLASPSIRPAAIMIALRRRIRASEAWFIGLAVLVGIVAGLLAILLGGIAHVAQQAIFGFSATAHLSALTAIAPIRLLALPIGGALLGLLTRLPRGSPRSAIDVVEANALHGGRIPWRDSLTVSGQTLLSNAVGASVGLEAAYAQMGGGFASVVGQWFNLRRNDLRTLVGAGAGAAVGAAFGAPLAGAFYAFEIVIGAYTPASIAPVAAAALGAAVTARALGSTPYLIVVAGGPAIHTLDYLLYAILGLSCATVGIGMMRLVSIVEIGVRRLPIAEVWRPCIGGLLLIPIAFVSPQALSAGHGALRLDINMFPDIMFLLIVLALKILASALSLGFGFRGGLFFASLFLGTLLGQIFALLATAITGLPLLSATDAALVGMAALAVAVVGGPMTMALLVLEATHNFELTATVLTACLCSSAVVREMFGYSFSTWRLHLRGESIRSARDIGWMRTLTAAAMMRRSPATLPDTTTITAFRARIPLGSTSRVLLVDAAGLYAGIVPTATAFADIGLADDAIARLATLQEAWLSPEMNITAIMRIFDTCEADDLAVLDGGRRIVGILTEKYVRRRYAEELERGHREIFGEV